MKTMLVTTPIRPRPTSFPPMGPLSIMNYLRKDGYDDCELYHIDSYRPPFEEVIAHIRERAPDVVGISAVVSTAYDYTKRLSLGIKEVLPNTRVVCGGNLAASGEVLLRRTGVDICVVGEGEIIFKNLVARAHETLDPTKFMDIPGLLLVDENDRLVNTGYERQLAADELYDIDWTDLERAADINHYFPKASGDDYEDSEKWTRYDTRSQEPHRRGKTVAHFPVSQGCPARCTFCHRWQKGIRHIPIDLLTSRLDELVERYNVGFLRMTGESFGVDKRWLTDFCEWLKPYDILWGTAVRAASTSEHWVQEMRAAGCVNLTFGNETGSERMLEIMEKKTSLKANYDCMEWAVKYDLWTGIQLGIAMPGETPETIRETIDYCKWVFELSPDQNPNNMSINYAQALPGTPLYEYARHHGIIGTDLDGEEEYLLAISDRDAHDEYTTLNFTDYSRLECMTWRPRITIEVNNAYVRRYGIDKYRNWLAKDSDDFQRERRDTGYYANPRRLLEIGIGWGKRRKDEADVGGVPQVPGLWYLIRRKRFGLAMICYPVLFYRLRHLLPLMVLLKNTGEKGFAFGYGLLREYLGDLKRRFTRRKSFGYEYKSLRRIVERDLGALPVDSPEMAPLRSGR